MSSTGAEPPLTAPPAGGIPGLGPWASPVAAVSYAPWSRRVLAVLLDVGLLGGIAWLAAGESGGVPSLWAGLFSPGDGAVVGWPAALAALVLLALQAWTGWTPGKLVVGIAVVRERDGAPAGILRTVGRAFAHLIDSFLLIGYLRPLWHREGRTFADSMAGTVVVLRRPDLLHEQQRALTTGALVLCLAGAGFGVAWQSSGGTRASAFAQCLPADPVDGDNNVSRYASAQVRGEENVQEERRLWMRRTTDRNNQFHVTWTWSTDTVPPGNLAMEATVSAPGDGGPSITERWGIAGRNADLAEITEVELEPDDGTGLQRATITVGDDGTPGDGALTELGRRVDVTTSFLVDGVPVASCTVPGLTLERTPWDF